MLMEREISLDSPGQVAGNQVTRDLVQPVGQSADLFFHLVDCPQGRIQLRLQSEQVAVPEDNMPGIERL